MFAFIPNLAQFQTADFIIFVIALAIAITASILTRRLLQVSFPYFLMGLIGLIMGLVLGSLISDPLSSLPGIYGRYLPIIINVFVAVGVLDLFLVQTNTVLGFFHRFFGLIVGRLERQISNLNIVVDTSSLIDGRIKELAQSGFVFGKLIIPRFVLNELQKIADSSEPLKRTKGRRGLEVLKTLQKNPNLEIEILEARTRSRELVDAKLVKLARGRKSRILTVDYNLNRVAEIQGVEVLNINELAGALRPVLLPGEIFAVRVIQKGKERGQGIGYLDDGTMIVVEGGDKLIGQEVEVEVVRIFQTAAGKMIFVEPRK